MLEIPLDMLRPQNATFLANFIVPNPVVTVLSQLTTIMQSPLAADG